MMKLVEATTTLEVSSSRCVFNDKMNQSHSSCRIVSSYRKGNVFVLLVQLVSLETTSLSINRIKHIQLTLPRELKLTQHYSSTSFDAG